MSDFNDQQIETLKADTTTQMELPLSGSSVSAGFSSQVESLMEILLPRFYRTFATECAEIVVCRALVEPLYQMAVAPVYRPDLSKAESDKLAFRSAYVLETIYFGRHHSCFDQFVGRFYRDFLHVTNESVKRHFSKIMYDLLCRRSMPCGSVCDDIARTCVVWVTEPHTKVAVKIWAIEVLIRLRSRVEWLSELLPELLEPMRRDPTPALQVRLRRWRDVRSV